MKLIQPHCGYYVYNGIYLSSREALLELMIANEDYKPSTNFYFFNDEIYDKLNWEIEPPQSLKKLYIERAIQLRDKYDYLILAYSGGADSHEVLETFLQNGIFIDEIQTVHYETILNKFDLDLIKNHHSIGVLHEYQASVLPTLRKVSQISPNTKITSIDASNFLVDQIINKRLEYMGSNGKDTNGMHLIKPHRMYNFVMHKNNNNTSSKNNVGFIRGIEKPLLDYVDDKLYFKFSDTPMHGVKLMRSNTIDEIYKFEDFFWSPECPLIPIKQAHKIKNFFKKTPKALEFFKKAYTEKFNNGDMMHDLNRLYSNIIYEHTKNIPFIAIKPKKNPEMCLASWIDDVIVKYTEGFINERKTFYLHKFGKINNRNLLTRNWASKLYYIGKI